jgi:hemerythrin-like domain-containing protein
MQSILEYMSNEHVKCDEHFATAEQQVSKSNWQDASTAFNDFVNAIERHLQMEEQVLFRYIERSMGNSGGPIAVMRMEHSQMRGLLQTMAETLEKKDKDGFLGDSETLLILMQQHNMKEEQIVYPMAERLLANGQDQVIAEMESL